MGAGVATLVVDGMRHGSAGECPKWNPEVQAVLRVSSARAPANRSGGATPMSSSELQVMTHLAKQWFPWQISMRMSDRVVQGAH